MIFATINQIIRAAVATGNPAVDMVTTVAVTEFVMRSNVSAADKIAAKNHWFEQELRRAYAF